MHRIAIEHAGEELREVSVDEGRHVDGEVGRADELEDLVDGGALEGQVARGQLVERHARRPHVHLGRLAQHRSLVHVLVEHLGTLEHGRALRDGKLARAARRAAQQVRVHRLLAAHARVLRASRRVVQVCLPREVGWVTL